MKDCVNHMDDSIGGFHVWSDDLGSGAFPCNGHIFTGNGKNELISAPSVFIASLDLAGLKLLLDNQTLDEAGHLLRAGKELLPFRVFHLGEGIVGGGEEGERSV